MQEFDAEWLDPIYATALQPSLWSNVLERLCGRVGAAAASINRVNPVDRHASLFIEFGTDPVYSAKLLTTYAGMSPIGSAVLTAEIDQPLTAFDFIDEDEYVASRFYKEWCAPQGYYDMLGAVLMKSTSDVSAISTVRSHAAGRFGVEQKAFVGTIAPHVRRAVTISGLLNNQDLERDALLAVAEALAAAVFILDANARPTWRNAAAEKLVAKGDLIVRHGALAMIDSAATAELRSALTPADARPALFTIKAADGTIYIAALLPVRATGPFALVINQQPPDNPAIGNALMQAFALTPRELTVLLALLKSPSIESAAAELGIEIPTARSHLHRIFAKTGTGRQAELVQKIQGALPPIAPKP